MTADEARVHVTEARRLLDRAMRALSVPEPDWEGARKSLDWAATLCMELTRDCRREAGHGARG